MTASDLMRKAVRTPGVMDAELENWLLYGQPAGIPSPGPAADRRAREKYERAQERLLK